VQAIVKLPLKAPLKLRVVKVPGMQFEQVSVYWDGRILKCDDNFHSLSLGAGVEIQ
jgi:hypothetical protein